MWLSRTASFCSARARGEAKGDSDIDLLAVKKAIPHQRRLAQGIYVSLIGISMPIDVIVVTPEDIEESRDAIGTIIPDALIN